VVAVVSPLSLLNPKAYTNDERMAIDRWRVCRECPELRVNAICGKCGCFMKAKVKLSQAECPLGKWKKEEAC
jgi:hypothetical protein